MIERAKRLRDVGVVIAALLILVLGSAIGQAQETPSPAAPSQTPGEGQVEERGVPGVKPPPLAPIPLALSRIELAPHVTGGATGMGTIFLTRQVPAGGVVEIALSSSNPSVATVPARVIVKANRDSMVFQFRTNWVADQVLVTISASYAQVTTVDSVKVLPVRLSDLSCNPNDVIAGTSVSCMVKLTGLTSEQGATVNMASSHPGVVPVPRGIPVVGGQDMATFTVPTNQVANVTSVTISAWAGGVTKTTVVTVRPVTLGDLSCIPNNLTGGTPANCRVYLTGPAPEQGALVNITSSHPGVAPVPPNVPVAARQNQTPFTVPTNQVATSTTITISASYGGVTRTATLTVTPATSSCSGFFQLTLSPTAFNTIPTTGALVTASVNLGNLGPAPAAGAMIRITQVAHPPATGGPGANLPSTVTVAPGQCITQPFQIRVYRCSPQYASCKNEFTAEYLRSTSSATVMLPMQ